MLAMCYASFTQALLRSWDAYGLWDCVTRNEKGGPVLVTKVSQLIDGVYILSCTCVVLGSSWLSKCNARVNRWNLCDVWIKFQRHEVTRPPASEPG